MAPLRPDELAALVVAVSFAAGLNVYATLATLGLLARSHVVVLPAALAPVADWWIIGASLVLFAVELVADKVPVFDLIWNALQTFVRVPVAALLAYAATTTLPLPWQLVATVAGAGLALAAHGGKLAVRSAVTASPEPFSNSVLSVIEDGLAVGLTWFAARHPFMAAAVTLVLLVMTLVAVRWIARTLRAIWRGRRSQPAPR